MWSLGGDRSRTLIRGDLDVSGSRACPKGGADWSNHIGASEVSRGHSSGPVVVEGPKVTSKYVSLVTRGDTFGSTHRTVVTQPSALPASMA